MVKNEFMARLRFIELDQKSYAARVGYTASGINKMLNGNIPKIHILALQALEESFEIKTGFRWIKPC